MINPSAVIDDVAKRLRKGFYKPLPPQSKTFTYDYYRQFLEQLLNRKYNFISFKEGKELFYRRELTGQNSQLIMRHDIDMDIRSALNLAKIERECNIKSTFFVMVSCPIYNIFEANNSDCLREIMDIGHHVGLHFDCENYNNLSVDNVELYIEKECRVLETILNQPVDSISFHRPGTFELNNVKLKKYSNSYEKIFLECYSYFSDSRCRWARGNPLISQEFQTNKNLQILVHPIWWQNIEVNPYERLLNIVLAARRKTEVYLAQNCSVWNENRY